MAETAAPARERGAGVTALVGAGAVVLGPAEPGPLRRATWDQLRVTAGVGVGVEGGRIALIAPDREVRA